MLWQRLGSAPPQPAHFEPQQRRDLTRCPPWRTHRTPRSSRVLRVGHTADVQGLEVSWAALLPNSLAWGTGWTQGQERWCKTGTVLRWGWCLQGHA